VKAYWLASPLFLYAAYAASRSDLRVELVLVPVAVTALAVIGPRSRALLGGLYPFALVGVLFDAMRAMPKLGVSESRVLLCELRALESRLFGWEADGQRVTLHDFFLAHHTPVLDALCAVPYATFLLWCVAGAVYLYARDRAAMLRFAWGFFLLNVAGFVTYHVLPAAPPWYFHEHGCVVDLATRASEGPALARVDQMLGFGYFHGMYAKASRVFGALPSLHCAYPLLLVLLGWRAFGLRLRALSIAYYVAMVFSAVYLDHHWVLDALLGSAYAIAVWAGARLLDVARQRRALAEVAL
jgi:hypothetical protein